MGVSSSIATLRRGRAGVYCLEIEPDGMNPRNVDADGLIVRSCVSRSTPTAIPLTDEQREELDQRLDEIDRNGPVGIPAEEVLGRLHTRRE